MRKSVILSVVCLSLVFFAVASSAQAPVVWREGIVHILGKQCIAVERLLASGDSRQRLCVSIIAKKECVGGFAESARAQFEADLEALPVVIFLSREGALLEFAKAFPSSTSGQNVEDVLKRRAEIVAEGKAFCTAWHQNGRRRRCRRH